MTNSPAFIFRNQFVFGLIVAVSFVFQGTARVHAEECKGAKVKSKEVISLFDGKTIEGQWEAIEYGGDGPISVENAELILGQGSPLTNIRWKGKELPRVNYEITFDAKRVKGNDFFVGLTFPVQKDHCSLILGGWGGALTGLSNLNGSDASANETTQFLSYQDNQWYAVRLRVTEKKIIAWLNDDKIVDVDYSDLSVSVRIEMELSKPLGLSTYVTEGAFRNLKLRELSPEEIQKGLDTK